MVAGMMMDAETDIKKGHSEGTMITNKVKDWMPPYVMMHFEDCNKQMHSVVLVVLPTEAVHEKY